MIVQKLTFSQIFQLWDDQGSGTTMAADMGMPRNRVRQWRNRHFIPPWYWPQLVEVIEQRFGWMITYRQLVEASIERGNFIMRQRERSTETRRKNRENAKTDEAA